MVRKLARIFGIVGGALTLLPYLVFIALCVHNLMLPDNEVHFESKGYASAFLILSLVYTLIAAAGFIGGFLVRKKHFLAGVMLIASGGLLLFIGLKIPYSFILSIHNYTVLLLFSRIPSLLLLAGGVLSLVYKPKAAAPPPGEMDSKTP